MNETFIEINLESWNAVCNERDELKRELGLLREATIAYHEDRDELKLEVERLSGKTGFCLQCEAYAKKAVKYEKVLVQVRDICYIEGGDHSEGLEMAVEIAKSALSETAGTEGEK